MVFARSARDLANRQSIASTRRVEALRNFLTTTPQTMSRTITATRHNVPVTLPEGLAEEQLLAFKPFNASVPICRDAQI